MSPDTLPPARVPFDLGLGSGPGDDVPGASRATIDAAYRVPEAAALQALIAAARLAPDDLAQAQALATDLAGRVRSARARAGGVDALMLEFSLDTEEGVALMCLAEALLRIPDNATRDELIRDKLKRGEWRSHVGASPSFFVNAAAWGLLITGRLMEENTDSRLEQALTSLLRRGGEPMIRGGVDLAMRLLGRQFVTGRTIEEALANAREREARGYTFSFDMLGEGAVTQEDAERYLLAYERAVRAIGEANAGRGVYAGNGISVKLSALHPRFTFLQRDRIGQELAPRVLMLAKLAREHDVGLTIDAEEADRQGITLDILDWLSRQRELAGWPGLGIVVQAYQKRAPPLAQWLAALARRDNRRLNVRLVKGAYWDTEIKRAQTDGLADYPVWTRKVHTDVAYLACARTLLGHPGTIYPQFGTHNAFTIAAVHVLSRGLECEFQLLHGMGEALYDHVVGPSNLGRRCRVYAPVGSHATLLPYLVRRLLENGANTSFVNRIVDPRVSIAHLVADPVSQAEATGGTPHPRIPLPRAIYPDRENSAGVDFSDAAVLRSLEHALACTPAEIDAAPVLADSHAIARRAADHRLQISRERMEVRNPADPGDRVGSVMHASFEHVQRALELAGERAGTWGELAVEERAACLERAAAGMQAAMPQLVALLVREAGRTLPNAVNEVREAVDFCRYYAREALAELARSDASPRGPMVCISPWNFPLSIFVGQIAAALAAGNPVLAKPAEQTPLVASVAVSLLHEAGVPAAALQYLPGPGETVGAALVADPHIAGVIFTGSAAVARSIHAQLARRDDDPVLIAETGGQNAMIVDSSALAEQVITDALQSAFDSAGQRCSALRVLCVQEDIAARVLDMLAGALRELELGDPRRLATDVGPVIDAGALARLERHVDAMRAAGFEVLQHRARNAPRVQASAARGPYFMPPTVVDLGGIAGLAHLRDEVFGPVLHVVRWRREQLGELVDAINASGYGLTHGIHSRIDDTVEAVLSRIRAGNVYVNRNMIGAVVGVQPFGGHGLSGTGPKAGGPLYLRRLVRTRVPMRLPPAGRITLPGPTGELNVLEFRPRGVVACIANDERALRMQARAAQGLGNRVIVLRSHFSVGMRHALDPARVELVESIDFSRVDAVMAALPPDALRELRAQVAREARTLVPVLVPSDDEYDLARLVIERTVTVNTAAAGGNAALLALAGQE